MECFSTARGRRTRRVYSSRAYNINIILTGIRIYRTRGVCVPLIFLFFGSRQTSPLAPTAESLISQVTRSADRAPRSKTAIRRRRETCCSARYMAEAVVKYTTWSRDLKCVVIFFFSSIIIITISKRLYRRFCVCMRFDFWCYPGLLVFSSEKSIHKKCIPTCIYNASIYVSEKKLFFFFFIQHTTSSRYIGIYAFLLNGRVCTPTAVGLRPSPSWCT
jgi:hypothetical protein